MKILFCFVLLLLLLGCTKKDETPTDNIPTTGTVSDIDGNIYKTVTIGTQIWMAENLKTTKFKDGSLVPLITDNTAWKNLTTSAYCWYKNDLSNKNIYGALYNWYAVNTGKLCPSGWHVPSDGEWTVLAAYLGGDAIAGGKLKESGLSHWNSPNDGATNVSGFTALPAGVKVTDSRLFVEIGRYGFFWSSVGLGSTAFYRQVEFDTTLLFMVNEPKTTGMSIRCIKD